MLTQDASKRALAYAGPNSLEHGAHEPPSDGVYPVPRMLNGPAET